MRKLDILEFIFLSLALSGCILPIPHKRIARLGYEGHVSDINTGFPVEDAVVSIHYYGGTNILTYTDISGQYKVPNVETWHGAIVYGLFSAFSLFPFLDYFPDDAAFMTIKADGYEVWEWSSWPEPDEVEDIKVHIKDDPALVRLKPITLPRRKEVQRQQAEDDPTRCYGSTNYVDVVDGITWKYVVNQGGAVLLNEETNDVGCRRYNPSIPSETSGGISVPSTLGGTQVTTIGSRAFYCCTNLAGVAIPMGVEEIGPRAFWKCESLIEVNLPESVTNIKSCAFSCCRNLNMINIPSHVTSIQPFTFIECRSLKSVLLPSSLKQIGYHAFASSGLTDVSIPHSVTNIAREAFAECQFLKSIDLPPRMSVRGPGCFLSCGQLQRVRLPLGMDRIPLRMFKGCSRLSSVSIPEGVRIIEPFAFEGCTALVSIELPHSITNIGDYAFYNCLLMDSVSIPASVMSLGDGAFLGCSNLKRVKFMGNAPSVKTVRPFETDVVIEVVEGTKGWDGDKWKSFKIQVGPSKGPNGGITNHQK